ncbi:hypothetical protein PBRA_000237 [Plasmodiophora brassicae]|uniref:Uncharacterized protein n=1 Tax=Plasmodiophora brassicae TaxID=37360 RepID=A0A0G4IH73_PLABS|nr:hypothetical protein PBRA_000237 [Plasmodiophora brassicae]
MARSKKSRTAANYALESTTESELVRSRMMTLTDAHPSGDMALPATIAGATAPDGVVRPPSKTARVSRRRLRQNVEEILASTVFEKPAEKSSEPRDLTSYQEELAVVKKKLASALKSKTTLQAQTIRLEKEVQKQSKQFDTLLRNAVESNGGNVERSEILETLRLEKCRSTGLSAKVQSLEAERAALQKKVDSIQESIKFSNVRELKIQNKAYFNEARRLRALAQKMAAQERIIDKDINKRIKEKTDLLQSSMDEDRQQMLVAHNSLESTLNDLRHRATSLSILAEDEKSENAALKKALDAVNEHQKSSQALQLTFQAQMAELQASLERKQSDLERTQANVDLLQKKLDDLTGQLVDERKASAIHSETVAKLTATIDSMTLKSNADLEQLRVQMEGKDAVVELHRQEVARSSELQETIARLQGQLSAESGSATLVAERCEKLEAQIKDVDARLHHAKQELDRAMENETTLRQTIADLETKREFEAAQATARINALQADLDAARAALTSQLAAGNDTVAALTLEIEALKTQLDKAAADAAALKADQAAALEKASMALAQERESSDQRVADLQRQLEAAQATAAGERAALQRTFDAELAAERASAASRADNDKETAVKFEQERATLQAKFDSDLAAQKALLTEQFDRDLTAARNESSGLSQKQGEEALQESLTLQKRLQTVKDALQEQVGHLQTQLEDGKAQRARDAQASDEQRQLMTAQIAEHANAIADLKSQLSKVESASVAAKEAELLTYVKFAKADSEQIQDLKAQLESSQNEVARLRARVAEAASAQPPAVLPAPEPVQVRWHCRPQYTLCPDDEVFHRRCRLSNNDRFRTTPNALLNGSRRNRLHYLSKNNRISRPLGLRLQLFSITSRNRVHNLSKNNHISHPLGMTLQLFSIVSRNRFHNLCKRSRSNLLHSLTFQFPITSRRRKLWRNSHNSLPHSRRLPSSPSRFWRSRHRHRNVIHKSNLFRNRSSRRRRLTMSRSQTLMVIRRDRKRNKRCRWGNSSETTMLHLQKLSLTRDVSLSDNKPNQPFLSHRILSLFKSN